MSHQKDLLEAALSARENAYCPYSHFAVGAALITSDGEIFSGANLDNASFGASICGERSAVASMVSSGKTRIKELLVVTDTNPPAAPCGICRQIMAEFAEDDMLVHLANVSGDVNTLPLKELLPHSFRGKDLQGA